MKQTIFIFSLISVLLTCSNPASLKAIDKKLVVTTSAKSFSNHQPNIFIKDKSQYDKTFIDGLSSIIEPIKLIDSLIVVGKDSAYFPQDLPINKEILFKGTNENISYLLKISRINYTNLSYSFQLVENGNKIIDSKSGIVILGSMFFLASEVDEDNLTGVAYGSSEYWDNTNDCLFSIRIGIGLDDNGKHRAILTYGCEDKNKQTFILDKCPTLRTE